MDLTLADVDVLDVPDTGREQGDALRSADGVELELASQYGGAESSGSIWVTVDALGQVVSVDISRTWRERLPAEEFADALFAAYTTAVRKSIAAEMAARRAARREPPESGRRAAPVADRGDLGAEEWLGRVLVALDDVDAQLREIARTRVQDPAEQDNEIRSPNGYLTLRLHAGGAAGITGNTTALAVADSDLLRQDVLDMFQDADLAVEH